MIKGELRNYLSKQNIDKINKVIGLDRLIQKNTAKINIQMMFKSEQLGQMDILDCKTLVKNLKSHLEKTFDQFRFYFSHRKLWGTFSIDINHKAKQSPYTVKIAIFEVIAEIISKIPDAELNFIKIKRAINEYFD